MKKMNICQIKSTSVFHAVEEVTEKSKEIRNIFQQSIMLLSYS